MALFFSTGKDRIAAALAGFAKVKEELSKGIEEILDRREQIAAEVRALSDEQATLIKAEIQAGKAIRALDALTGAGE